MDWSQETIRHLQEHLKFPTAGRDILAACSDMSDIPQHDRDMIKERVNPDKMYNSLDDLTADIESGSDTMAM